MTGQLVREPVQERPVLITEIWRYSNPENMWSFSRLEPTDDMLWSIYPFCSDRQMVRFYDEKVGEDELGPNYKEAGVEVCGDLAIERFRDKLIEEGYHKVAFVDLPAAFKSFVCNQQAPLEWQTGLNEGDSEVTSRIVVWVNGELPSEVG